MNNTQLRPSNAMKAVALIIGWMALTSFRELHQLELVKDFSPFNIAVTVTAIAGAVSAIGIWQNSRWMLIAYVIWLVTYIVVRAWHDMQIEPVAWKVGLGVVILAAFWGIIGFFLYREYDQIRKSSELQKP